MPTPGFPHFYYMLGANLGLLLYGEVSVMCQTFYVEGVARTKKSRYPASRLHRRAIKEVCRVVNRDWVNHQACSLLHNIHVESDSFVTNEFALKPEVSEMGGISGCKKY